MKCFSASNSNKVFIYGNRLSIAGSWRCTENLSSFPFFFFFFAEMDLHKRRLASVCSIYAAKDVLENPRSVHAVNFSEAIIIISPGVNVLLDSPNVHPPYMCYCRVFVKFLNSSAQIGNNRDQNNYLLKICYTASCEVAGTQIEIAG